MPMLGQVLIDDGAVATRAVEAALGTQVETRERIGQILVRDGLDPEALPSDTLLIVASDHGNVEDITAEHTRNPALGLVVGPGHEGVAEGLVDLWDVPAAVLRAVGVSEG